MKKRILALLLGLLMCLPLLLTSCGNQKPPEDTTEEEDLYVKPATLNFYIIGDNVTAEAVRLMENAFNETSRELYKTEVHFVFCTAEEYSAKVMAELDRVAELNKAQQGQTPPKTAAEKFEAADVVTSMDDLNTVVEQYPEIYNNQMDILLITSKEMYDDLREKNYLANLTELLNTEFRDIAQKVNNNLVGAATIEGQKYAVPNNVLIGKYKYVLVNKEMAYLLQYAEAPAPGQNPEKYYTTADGSNKKVLDYAALLELAADIQACKSEADPNSELYSIHETLKANLGASEIFPMQSAFDYPTVAYFPKSGENTLFGVVYDYNSTYQSYIALSNVFTKQSYKNHFALMLEAKQKGYYPTEPQLAPTDAAYGIIYTEGSYTDRFAYQDDYFVFEVDQPRLEDDGAFNAMFAVSSFSASTERSLEIIEALVADEGAELRNILQYGVEKTHYTIDAKTGILTRTLTGRNQYKMNANYTGNIITAFPCPEDGRDANYAGYFKTQNDSATRNPLYGMTPELLWKNTKSAMENRILYERMYAALVSEIDELPASSNIFKDKNVSEVKAKLKSEIPDEINTANLREYWEYIRAGFDPTLTYEEWEIPEIPYSVTSALRQLENTTKAAVKMDVEAFMEQSALMAKQYMDRALLCTTTAELDALCDEIDRQLRNNKTEGIYFYGDRTSSWGGSTAYVGMLVNKPDAPISLASALQVWLKDVVMAGKQ